ncbi:MAG: tetratricopeptide repeat protein [Bacteroidales bacterium]|nr:tetratricopeptide repeat protein [Bacteroidales bacterium]
MNNEISNALLQLQLAQGKGDVDKMAEIYAQLADLYHKIGQTKTALGICLINIQMLQQYNDKQKLGHANIKMARIFGDDSGYCALPFLQDALSLFTEIGDEEGTATTYYWLGKFANDNETAINYFATGAELFEKLRHGGGLVLCLTHQGAHLTNLGKYTEAEAVLEKAVYVARQINDPELLDDALYHLAKTYNYDEKHFKGQKLIEEAIDINRKTEDYYDLAYMLYTYGQILMDTEKYDEAIAAFKESENLNRMAGDLKPVPEILCKLGRTYFYKGDNLAALQYFSQELSMRSDYDDSKITTLSNLAYVCIQLGYTQEAVNYGTMRLNLLEHKFKIDNENNDKAEALYDLAQAYEANLEYPKAERACIESIKIYQAIAENNQDFDTAPLENAKELLDKIEKKIPQEHGEIPTMDVPDVYTPEFIYKVLVPMLSDKLGVDQSEFSPEAQLTNDLGADDLDTIETIMMVEKEFNISLPDEECEKVVTVGDLAELVMKHL